MAACPSCPSTGLQHTLLFDTLPAHGCPTCEGLLLSLVVYRHWRETEADEALSPEAIVEPVADTDEALQCPKCHALMTKYRFAASVTNRIDYCAHCEELWFDAGEWALVESIARSGKLAAVFGRPWQRKVRRDISDVMESERLRALLGDDYEKFNDFRDWFNEHPERSRLLAMLARKRT